MNNNNIVDMKEKIEDIKKRVGELEDNLKTNFVSKEFYKLEIDQIHKRISDVEINMAKLEGLPSKVQDHSDDIDGFNRMLSRIAWFVLFSILGAFMAFIYKGGLA